MQISLDEIVSIEEYGEIETVDITVSGDNLFFANGILTHNSGYNNSDVSLTDTSESFGLPATADFMFAAVRTEDLDELGQIMCIQLKSRYGDVGYLKKFVIGVDIKKFLLFDVENSAQEDLVNAGPAFDNSKFGENMKAEKVKYDFNFD